MELEKTKEKTFDFEAEFEKFVKNSNPPKNTENLTLHRKANPKKKMKRKMVEASKKRNRKK